MQYDMDGKPAYILRLPTSLVSALLHVSIMTQIQIQQKQPWARTAQETFLLENLREFTALVCKHLPLEGGSLE